VSESTERIDPVASAEAELLAMLRERESAMEELLRELAEAESPSREPASQAEVFGLLADALGERGFAVETLPGQDVGPHMLAHRGAPAEPPEPGFQLIIGHLDTVWPLGTLAEMPVERRGERLHGPGVFDMKGGLVQALFAFDALAEVGLEPTSSPVVLIASDEEIGSPDSRQHSIRLARDAGRAFVVEPSFGPSGSLKTARKGVGRFDLRIKGVASHAGIEPEKGVSAILELSRQVQRLFELNDVERGITVNVGTIDGGLGANVIAPEAVARVEARVPRLADVERIEAGIRSLEPTQPGIEIEVSGGFGRPPLERTPRNRRLWEQAQAAAARIGIELDEAAVGGASDGNLASGHTAVLDGIGAVGDGAHAPEEHVIVARMPERAALLATLLTGPLEDVDERDG
jgi:glutamate carboxypeptidase